MLQIPTLRSLITFRTVSLREIGMSFEEALLQFNLAPLSCRREMSILGLIHRTARKVGPKQFGNFLFRSVSQSHCYFTQTAQRRPSRQFHDPFYGAHQDYIGRSALGMITV